MEMDENGDWTYHDYGDLMVIFDGDIVESYHLNGDLKWYSMGIWMFIWNFMGHINFTADFDRVWEKLSRLSSNIAGRWEIPDHRSFWWENRPKIIDFPLWLSSG